mmetsp:Transcript_10179/g.22522  ORF Transcript_10179/g.22522 Transcript_10179/m.22522 type:complete len:288 (-) Transcript_10179:119-982(-)
MLKKQHRMHETISELSSKAFYDCSIENDSTTQRVLSAEPCSFFSTLWGDQRVQRAVWVDTLTPQTKAVFYEDGFKGYKSESTLANSTSWKNDGEAEVVVRTVELLLKQGISPDEIALITPYRAQMQALQNTLWRGRAGTSDSPAKRVCIDTIHGYQGSEKDYTILSFVRSISDDATASQDPMPEDVANEKDRDARHIREILAADLGIVDDPKLLNVSVTRARKGLICVGNRALLSGSDHFYNLTKILADKDAIVPSEDFLAINLLRGGSAPVQSDVSAQRQSRPSLL